MAYPSTIEHQDEELAESIGEEDEQEKPLSQNIQSEGITSKDRSTMLQIGMDGTQHVIKMDYPTHHQ
jgi:hypothetical protein